VYLVLDGDANHLRLWRDGRVALGKVEGGHIDEHRVYSPPSTSGSAAGSEYDSDIEYLLEFRSFLNTGRLRLELRENDQVIESDEIFLTSSPLVLNHHLQQTEHVWVLDADFGPNYNNQQMIGVYEDILEGMFTAIDGPTYEGDPWVQDEFQFGWTQAPGLRNDIVVDSIRDRPLDRYPEDELEQPDWVVMTWGDTEYVNSLDSFGNLEVSPPVTVDGVYYPFGRIYFGGDEDLHPDKELTDFLASQQIQNPFQVDTTWLCVSHIDEISSFVPDSSAPRGFRFVWADTNAAWQLLESMDGNAALAKYGVPYPGGHDLDNVDAFLDSSAIRFLNEELQEDYLDPLLDLMKTELDLSDEEILLMPSLFEEPPGCFGNVAALIPGMANLFVTNRGEQTDIFLADPFMRDTVHSSVGQDQDPFIDYVEQMMPDDIDFHFVDDWSIYHMSLGEVHCGSNSTRTPAANWWEVAAHLLPEAP
jgi:protein-arginine deiminase